MKKLVVLVLAIVGLTTMTHAQTKGEMAAGVHFAYGSGDGFSNMGFGAKFQWNVLDNLRVEPSFTYFLKKDYVSMWDISANAHYQFMLSEKFDIYPLAGLSIMGVKAGIGEYKVSDSEFGLNLGGGVDFDLSSSLALNVEAKYQIGGNWSRFIASVGVVYKF